VAEAAYWIVRHLIWEPTTKSLAQLTSAIDRQFWTSPFTENGEGIELGVPPQFQSLEENPDNPDSWQEWFDSMWRNPSTRGLNPEGEDLEALLRSRYWRWRCLLDDGEFVDDELTDIESDLGFFFDLANLGSPDIADFADALLMAHRYGLFGAGEAP